MLDYHNDSFYTYRGVDCLRDVLTSPDSASQSLSTSRVCQNDCVCSELTARQCLRMRLDRLSQATSCIADPLDSLSSAKLVVDFAPEYGSLMILDRATEHGT